MIIAIETNPKEVCALLTELTGLSKPCNFAINIEGNLSQLPDKIKENLSDIESRFAETYSDYLVGKKCKDVVI